MPITTYERLERRVEKTVPCRVCGKKIKRATTLGQTLSPFNTNDNGTRKSRDQIREELKRQAVQWHPANDAHAKCASAEASS
jgi:hypothetical protein